MKSHTVIKTKRAFTLIELLVVIAVIALLAAILFPVFARARENARRASCQSNMKQIGLGILQYAQDYDENMPYYQANYPITDTPWQFTIQPYLKSIQLFKCPSNIGPASSTVYATPSPANGSVIPSIPISYVANGGDETSSTGMGGVRPFRKGGDARGPVSLAILNLPATTIAVSEVKNTQGNAINPYLDNRAKFYGANTGFTSHLKMANILFIDGHVKTLKPTATATTGQNMWTVDNTGTYSGLQTDLATGEANME
jgi:prepilin-type N-terminal cleavage/methylation domain-containing protein/prepilin-type processing-associated H-X9-DG protein